MRVSAQRSSQRSKYAWASSRLSKRIPLSDVLLAWPTPESTFPRFRVDDLLELREQLDRWKRGEGERYDA